MQEPTVTTDIQMLRGFRNMLFGGEGLFLATLTGPGRVWLQSMPILDLAEAIARHMPSREAADASIGAGGGEAIGGILGGLLSNE